MNGRVKPIDDILKESWDLYRQRAVPILIVILLTTFAALVVVFSFLLLAFFLAGGFEELAAGIDTMAGNPLLLLAFLVFLLLITVVVIWSQAATVVVSVDQDIGITEALRASWKYLLPLAWIGTLYLGVMTTGLFLFLVPALFFGLSMSLCFYTMVDEDLRGMDALLASHYYVRGRWWNTFGKFTAVWVMSMAVGMVPYLGQVLSLLFTPYMLLFMVVVYRDLKETAGEVDLQGISRWPWNLMAAVGILLPLLGLLGALVSLGPRLPGMMEQLEQGEIPGLDLPQLNEGKTGPPSTGAKAVAPSVRQMKSLDGVFVWHDPVGDSDNPLLDISRVSVQSGENELVLTLNLARPLEDFFAAAHSETIAPLVTFYLDTDVRRMTGGPARGGAGRAGYDLQLDVVLEALPGDSGRVHAALYRLGDDQRRSMGEVGQNAITRRDNELQIRLPYSELGLQGGQTVRICFYESGQQSGGGLSKDKLVPLEE